LIRQRHCTAPIPAGHYITVAAADTPATPGRLAATPAVYRQNERSMLDTPLRQRITMIQQPLQRIDTPLQATAI